MRDRTKPQPYFKASNFAASSTRMQRIICYSAIKALEIKARSVLKKKKERNLGVS